MAIPVIFDTDAGSDIDDLYALAYILQEPRLQLLGVTTVAGDTQARARLVAKMLRLAGRVELPVLAGVQVPPALVAQGVTLAKYKQNLTHTAIVGPDDPEHGRQYGDACAYILDQLDQAGPPVTLIATGPWTNLAEVLARANARQRARIGCLALMGGEVQRLHVESNVMQDPEGAAAVLASGLPIFMGTWDVTRQLYYTMAEVEALLGPTRAPFTQALLAATRMWWGAGRTEKPGPVCYDVIPAFWAAGERQAISCIRLTKLAVELTGTHTRGMTISPTQHVLRAPSTQETAPGHLTVTQALDAPTLKQRFSAYLRAF